MDAVDGLVGVGAPFEEHKTTRLVWLGKPGDVRINQRFTALVTKGKNGKPRGILVTSKPYRLAVESMALAFGQQHERDAMLKGHLMVSVLVWVKRQHRVGPGKGLACIDVDACCKAVLDALTKARVYEDDSQVRDMFVHKRITDGGVERITVEVSPCKEPSHV